MTLQFGCKIVDPLFFSQVPSNSPNINKTAVKSFKSKPEIRAMTSEVCSAWGTIVGDFWN